TLVLLSNPLLLGSRNALGARAAVAYAERGPVALRALVMRAAAVLSAMQAAFTVVLVLGAVPIVKLFFGEQFEAQPAILLIVGCCTITGAVNVASGSAVVAMRRSDIGFRSIVAGLLMTLGVGVFLIPAWGGLGAACALLGGSLLAAGIQWFAFLRLTRECGGCAAE
ncbi:MAG TPA: polysaccharide biosynthesis C-terminal domain-containing protein, partial [Pirellulaceae bacterium]|nr:polysaccharide biosynthesis C-terminal domain-containing protein [Pirellulaceae bacterium]